MECPRVCVIDSSPAILETIPIVLGGAYGVDCFTPEQFLRDPSQLGEPDLLIIADDALPAESLSSLRHGPPILWLQTRRGPPPIVTGQWAQVPRAFSPEDLRARIQALLSAPARPETWKPWPVIDYPLIPKEAALVARQASANQMPVLICGEPGTGKRRLARTIHSLGRGGGFLALSRTTCEWATLQEAVGPSGGNVTAFVADVGDLGVAGRDLLLEILDCGGFSTATGWHGVRLICATAQRFDGSGASAGIDKELFLRLSVLPIDLPALRERAYDIPALAHYIVTEIGRRSGGDPVTLTARAIHRLMHYLWFGNLAELETVVTRTLTLTPSRIIDAEDLLFGFGPIVPRATSAPNGLQTKTVESSPADAAELIIHELAHEFKNPMVTIKTVAQHLERLLADEAGRQQIAQLTGEAVDRMDRTLENLLQFTRFRTPAAEVVSWSELLTPVLTELTPALAERRIALSYQPNDAPPVFVDAAQIVYAFENMLRAIGRDLAEGQVLSVRPLGATAAVLFEFTSPHHATAGRIAEFLDSQMASDAASMPLGLLFAKVLIERNGGGVDIRVAGDKTTITVRLPSRAHSAPRDGQATNLNS